MLHADNETILQCCSYRNETIRNEWDPLYIRNTNFRHSTSRGNIITWPAYPRIPGLRVFRVHFYTLLSTFPAPVHPITYPPHGLQWVTVSDIKPGQRHFRPSASGPTPVRACPPCTQHQAAGGDMGTPRAAHPDFSHLMKWSTENSWPRWTVRLADS